MDIVFNLEKVGLGSLLFLGAYLSNMGLGTWQSVKIEGIGFDWRKMVNSLLKFAVLALSIGMLSMVVSAIPMYATFVGIQIEEGTLQAIDSLVIMSSFFVATIKYTTEAIGKLKNILS